MRKHLTEAEFAKLKLYLGTQETDLGAKLIELIALTGIRQAEACELQAQDFDFSDQCLKIKSKKSSKPRLVPLDGEHIKRLAPLHKALRIRNVRAGQLITNACSQKTQGRIIRRLWAKIAHEVFGGYPISLHGLRHSFVLRVFKATNDNVLLTQKLIGHRNLNSTMKYLDYFETLEHRVDVLKANG